LCESEEGLILLDQHAAHERIRYEQLKASWNKPGKSTQGLLTPLSLDLSYAEADTMKSLLPELEKIGFSIEPFGGSTFVVKSIPAILSNKAVQDLLLEMIEKVTEIGVTHGLEKAMEKCLTLMACHETVRGNQKLTMTEMQALLEQLDRCENPNNCPHGRPVWISWTIRFLEKSFSRIV
jgi:DNA mismatch repair protein MutL